MLKDYVLQEKVFYLGLSGIEYSKSRLNSDNNWNTDVIKIPENDKKRLLSSAAGETVFFGEGGFKMIREKGSNTVYSIGFTGKTLASAKCYSFQKLVFSIPFKKVSWGVF